MIGGKRERKKCAVLQRCRAFIEHDNGLRSRFCPGSDADVTVVRSVEELGHEKDCQENYTNDADGNQDWIKINATDMAMAHD